VGGVIDLTGQFRAPLLDPTIVGIVLAAFLVIPVALRLRSLRVLNTKDTKGTKESNRSRGQERTVDSAAGLQRRPASQAGSDGETNPGHRRAGSSHRPTPA
jgi:hypothetical protein